MFAEPTADDFKSWIEWHLKRAADEAARSINAVQSKFSAAGHSRSGRTIIVVFEEAFKAFDRGADAALGELKRAIRKTTLDPHLLRQMTEVQLRSFVEQLKVLTRYQQLRDLAKAPVDERLTQLDDRLVFALRQFDVGFLDPLEPEVPLSMNNSINIGVMSGGAVQQGTSHSTQKNTIDINIGHAQNTLQTFEEAISLLPIPSNHMSAIAADIATMKAQLAKPSPSALILQEAGRSIRALTEGAIAGALTAPAIAAPKALWKVLGLG